VTSEINFFFNFQNRKNNFDQFGNAELKKNVYQMILKIYFQNQQIMVILALSVSKYR